MVGHWRLVIRLVTVKLVSFPACSWAAFIALASASGPQSTINYLCTAQYWPQAIATAQAGNYYVNKLCGMTISSDRELALCFDMRKPYMQSFGGCANAPLVI